MIKTFVLFCFLHKYSLGPAPDVFRAVVPSSSQSVRLRAATGIDSIENEFTAMPDRLNEERIIVDEALIEVVKSFGSGSDQFSTGPYAVACEVVFCHYQPGLDAFLFKRSSGLADWAIYLKPYSGTNEPPITFQIRIGASASISITESPSKTILELKSIVAQNSTDALAPEIQKWIYNGRILSNSLHLAVSGIKNGDTVQVMQVCCVLILYQIISRMLSCLCFRSPMELLRRKEPQAPEYFECRLYWIHGNELKSTRYVCEVFLPPTLTCKKIHSFNLFSGDFSRV